MGHIIWPIYLRLTITADGFIPETSVFALRISWVTVCDAFISFFNTNILANTIELEIPGIIY